MIISQCDSCGKQQPYDPQHDELFYVQHPTPDGVLTEQFCSPQCVVRQLSIDYSLVDEDDYEEVAQAATEKHRAHQATTRLTKLIREEADDKVDYQPEGQAAALEGLTVKQLDEITGVTRK